MSAPLLIFLCLNLWLSISLHATHLRHIETVALVVLSPLCYLLDVFFFCLSVYFLTFPFFVLCLFGFSAAALVFRVRSWWHLECECTCHDLPLPVFAFVSLCMPRT